jgi:hypothetical protein
VSVRMLLGYQHDFFMLLQQHSDSGRKLQIRIVGYLYISCVVGRLQAFEKSMALAFLNQVITCAPSLLVEIEMRFRTYMLGLSCQKSKLSISNDPGVSDSHKILAIDIES